MSLEQLAEISRRYGARPEWVLAGGGNTSYKTDTALFVKASGFPLATIRPEGFARMRRAELQKVWSATYPSETEAREAAALADLMAAREEGEEKRPSVETLMHELFPYAFVVHTHPSLVNGITCAQNGEQEARRLFGESMLWVPAIEPGYILALEMRRLAQEHEQRTGSFPRLVLMQNHGLVVAGDRPEEIDELHEQVERTIRGALAREPDFSPVDEDDAARDRWHTAIEAAYQREVAVEFETNAEILRRLDSWESFAAVAGAFTPDHIVYAGSAPVYAVGPPVTSAAGLRSQITDCAAEHGSEPRIVAVQGVGVFAVTESLQASDTAMALFTDELKIAAYAESFGGARPLDPHLMEFIESWEVERYRRTLSEGGT